MDARVRGAAFGDMRPILGMRDAEQQFQRTCRLRRVETVDAMRLGRAGHPIACSDAS
jgi:hypothetical protein